MPIANPFCLMTVANKTMFGGADWDPTNQQVTFESLINIRPRQNNRSLEIMNPAIRERVAQIVQQLLGDA